MPTLVITDDEEIPDSCFGVEIESERALPYCVQNDNTADLALHLDAAHKGRKLDGLVFMGSKVHRQLLEQLAKDSPSMFSAKSPGWQFK